MNRAFGFLMVVIIFSSPALAEAEISLAPPMVDGNCNEYPNLLAKKRVLSEDVSMYLFQDKHYVWLCYSYPEGSFSMLDLTLTTKQLKDSLNLHVSAQLGEWPVSKPELKPKTAESEQWWNNKEWIANTIWYNGIAKESKQPRAKFKNANARELQLSKNRFGRGDWKIRLKIDWVKGKDGKFYNLEYPKDNSELLIDVY